MMNSPQETEQANGSCPQYFEETEQICPDPEKLTLRDIFEIVLGWFGVKEVLDDED